MIGQEEAQVLLSQLLLKRGTDGERERDREGTAGNGDNVNLRSRDPPSGHEALQQPNLAAAPLLPDAQLLLIGGHDWAGNKKVTSRV
jgi:hypothetical protein